ncbi:LptA/OstA family protein [Dyella sp. 2HG41-7]|uniref:LptA/OstA family protein n=1 Tax=Dyella sp. 2HG41-7 TaxID=2883239 RepID=UPI001F284266|nr:LptA/OstA family protein [Dyella sp. 2HG41-7]
MKPVHDSRARYGNGPLLGLCAALLLLPLAAHAKTGDRNQPMNTSQASVNGFNAPNTITTLTGNVVVTQGTMKAKGAVAQLYLDKDSQVARIVMKGSPAHIEQLDDNNHLMTGEAPTLDYDNINGIAVLQPDAVVTQQGMGDAHADKLTYNTNTSYFTGTGNISMTYLPKQKQEGAPAPATSAPASTASAATPQK